MDNNELDNVEQNPNRLDTEQIVAGVGLLGAVFGIIMTIKAHKAKKALKKEQEKNALFQETIRKHQAEIDALKNDRERETYKNKLWEEFLTQSEE